MGKMFIHPVQEKPSDPVVITQRFGENPAMYRKYGLAGHNGIDYRTRFWFSPLGKIYVVAPAGGLVIETGNEGKSGYGIYLRIRHDDGSVSVLGHMTKLYVAKGRSVKQGQRVALSGNTGNSTGPHVHWGYRPPKPDFGNGYAGYVDQSDLVKP